MDGVEQSTAGGIVARGSEHFLIVDDNLEIRHLSRSLLSLGGREAEEMLGLPLGRLFEEKGCEALRRWLASADSSATLPSLRLRPFAWSPPTDRLRWTISRFEVNGGMFAVISSVESGAGSTAADIFATSLGEIVDEACMAFVVTDSEGRIVLLSKGAVELSDFQRDEMIERMTLADLFPVGEELERLEAGLAAEGRIDGQVMTLRRRDGQLRSVRVTSRQLFNSNSEFAGRVVILMDQSEEMSLSSEIQALYNQLERFGTITAQIISIEDSEQLFQQFAQAITEISDFSRSLISIFTDEPPYREIIAYSGVEEEDIHHLRQVQFPPERLESLMREEFRLSPNCYYIPGTRRKEVLDDQEVVSGTLGVEEGNGWKPDDNLIVSLRKGRNLLGFLSVDDCKSGQRPTADTVKPLELFATQISEVLVRNRLEEELLHRHRDLQLLHEIMMIVNSSLDADEVLQKLVENIREQMGYSLVSVYLIDEGKLALKAHQGPMPSKDLKFIDLGTGLVGIAALRGHTVISGDVRNDNRFLRGPIDTVSEIAVPIKSSAILNGEETESIIGVLNVENTTPIPFIDEDARRLEAIAATASVAIENSRLMDRVLSLLKEEANYSQELEQKKAELDEFIYTISHDLKSPLSSIKGYAEMLELEQKGELNEKTERFLSRIKANAEAVSRMINDLLELSRVGKVVEESRPIDLKSLLYEIALDIRASAELGEVNIEYVDLPERITADRSRLGQLFTNLISNAYKYRHPDREPVITVGCETRQHEYVFYVADNGIGIDASYLQSIFVFGVRVREVKVEGTGAGLAIAKKITETMGGRIWAESRKGEGSTFYFTIPR